MTSRRLLKAAEAIREVVSMAILAELRDPRVRNVTVTGVEVSADMRQAKVKVSVMGDETRQNLSLTGLRSAAGFLQSKIAERIETRYTPRLHFVLDQGVKKSIEIARLLKKVLPESTPPPAEPDTGAEEFESDDDTGGGDSGGEPAAAADDAALALPPESPAADDDVPDDAASAASLEAPPDAAADDAAEVHRSNPRDE
jgi:ribosome-binding factor A